MSFTITLGWWLLPVLVTIGAFGWALSIKDQGDYDFGPVLALIAAFTPTLAAWLIWALLT